MLYPRALADQLEDIGPDVVHLHSGVLYKASLAASLAGIPRQIYTDHGRQNPDPWLNRAIDARASHRVDAVVAVSDALRDHLAKFLAYPKRICVVRNGVDTDSFAPGAVDDVRSELGIDPNAPIVASTGRFEPVKGYSVLIDAFASLVEQYDGDVVPVLVLVGDGSERSKLEEAASARGLASHIHFLGWRSDIQRLSRAFTLFCMSSHSEGTSVSLLEAMSCGICPVVTDVGGNAAVLGPSLAHRLVPAGNPEALASALHQALQDRAARERDAVIARQRIVDDFSLSAMVQQYEDLYRGIGADGDEQ
jgi:glycosyltransferase involved in cell wall biosynthesis